MRVKTALLTTTALAITASLQSAHAGQFYLGAIGGANWQPSGGAGFASGPTFFGGHLSTSVHPDSDTGFVVGATVGAHLDQFVPGLRVEVEGAYRRNKIGGNWSSEGFEVDVLGGGGPPFPTTPVDNHGSIDGTSTTYSVMANVWYDFDVGQKWRPYVGGGAGWARTKDKIDFSLNGTLESHLETDGSGFAWQLGAGITYPIADNVNLGIGYRYFRTPDVDPVFFGKHDAPVDLRNDNHSVAVTLTVDLD